MHFLVKRGERKRILAVCVFSRRSNARTMNDKDVEKEPLQSIIQTCDKSCRKINSPFRHDGVLRWRASFVLYIEDWKK